MSIDVQERLRRWAEALTSGDGSGYPSTSPLHPNWQPPSPGQTPVLKAGFGVEVAATHRAVRALGSKGQAALLVHYVMRWPVMRQAQALGCQERTVFDRRSKAEGEVLQALQAVR